MNISLVKVQSNREEAPLLPQPKINKKTLNRNQIALKIDIYSRKTTGAGINKVKISAAARKPFLQYAGQVPDMYPSIFSVPSSARVSD